MDLRFMCELLSCVSTLPPLFLGAAMLLKKMTR